MTRICEIWILTFLFYLCPESGVLLGVEVAMSEEPSLLQAQIHQAGQRLEEEGGDTPVQVNTQWESGEVERSSGSKH